MFSNKYPMGILITVCHLIGCLFCVKHLFFYSKRILPIMSNDIEVAKW